MLDRFRRFVVDGRPVATGFTAIGDARACTKPSAGRGMTVGMLHAEALRDVIRSDLSDPERFVLAWHRATETSVSPYYWSQIAADRARVVEMDARREGKEPPAPDAASAAIATAMMRDPDVFRGMLEVAMCMAQPEEVFARPGFMEKVDALAGSRVWKIPGPDRAALVDLVGRRS